MARTTARDDGATVAQLDQHVDAAFDINESGQTPPFRVRIGSREFLLQPPDTHDVMDLEEAGTTRRFLQIAFDEQWDAAEDAVGQLEPAQMAKLIRQYGAHFGLDQQSLLQQAAPNREERRRRRGRRS